MWLTNNKNLYIQQKIRVKYQAHNLKVVGSNPTPATKYLIRSMTYTNLKNSDFWGFLVLENKNLVKMAKKMLLRTLRYFFFLINSLLRG